MDQVIQDLQAQINELRDILKQVMQTQTMALRLTEYQERTIKQLQAKVLPDE
jgi:hypothetical protein